jgi:predicted  nucleic acid-binding Zn-ribbon protein
MLSIRRNYMEFICAKCNTELEKNHALLTNGCHNCGSKVFKTLSTPGTITASTLKAALQIQRKRIEQSDITGFGIVPRLIKEDVEGERIKDLDDDNIPTIKLKQKGVYEVNIGGLFRDKKSDPIILSGKSGIYKVELPGGNKEEE